MLEATMDYPAAHSMDTEWFAVDAHGRIARFDTGEDGAMPHDAAIGFSPADGTFDVDLLAVARLANVLGQGRDPRARDRRPPRPETGRLVVVVDRPELMSELLSWGRLRVVRERDPGVLLSVGELSETEARRLAEREGVRWTSSTAELDELLDGYGGRATDDGLFHFTRDHGADPGLYERARAPSEPIELDELDEAIRHEVGSMRLPVDFSVAAQVHLADHIDESEAVLYGDLPLRYTEDYAQRVRARARRSWTGELWILAIAALILLALAWLQS